VLALVTGATGKVGHALALALLERGDRVRALVRDPSRARAVLPDDVEPVKGDVVYPSTLRPALRGVEVAFNAMGLPEQWLPDPRAFERVNARGTESLVRAAGAAGARRVVHTSTIDVFHAEPGGSFDESDLATYPKGTEYERSKQLAERLALSAGADTGIEVVLVNPAGVFGPGPGGDATSLEESLLRPVLESRRAQVPMLPPGGMGLVHSHGLARGQLLAAERGEPGERYILCDGHMSFREMAQAAVRLAGRGSVPPVMPVPVARAAAAAGEALAGVIRQPPLIPRGQLHFFLWDARPRSDRARAELGWERTPLEEGLRASVAALG
jgi:dihydroflavonol-4-reductase